MSQENKLLQPIRECVRCGDCCQGYNISGVALLPEDYERWVNEERTDILAYVKLSTANPAGVLTWTPALSREQFNCCPFLEQIETGYYRCGIEETQPAMCRLLTCSWLFGTGDKCIGYKTFAWYKQPRAVLPSEEAFAVPCEV